MRFDSLEVREVALDLVSPFETSFGRTTSRRILLVRVAGEGLEGWGECTAPEGPYYNEEFTAGAWEAIIRFVAPRVLAGPVERADDVRALFSPIRGNRMARAAVETAVWDYEARCAGRPLWRHLGGSRDSIPCGVSIGLQPTATELVEAVARELEAGYRRIKIKIAPGRDVELVEAVRSRFPEIVLSVDANAAYTLADLDTLRRLDGLGLLMIEQPLRPGDLVDHARLQALLATPICLDESIVDDESAEQAFALGSCRIVNLKLGRVGGHAEARRIASRCEEAGVPVWCGGMLESGIGRLHNAAVSSLGPLVLPGDVSDSRRYWARDIVAPRPVVRPDGTMQLSEEPGLGARVDEAFLDSITVARRLLTP